MRSRRLVVIAAVAAAAFAGQVTLSGAAGTKTIAVDDDFFAPKRATVAKNTLVTFRWRGESEHDVKSSGKARFKNASLKSSGTHKVRLKNAGTYRYSCTVHDGMAGTIVVR